MPEPTKAVPTGTTSRRKPLRRTARGTSKVEMARVMVDIIDDPEVLKEWDDEELARGQRRDKDGKFRGRPPTVMPRAILVEQQRRKVSEANDRLVRSVDQAVEALAEIVVSSQDDKARVKAAELIMTRVMGRVDATVNINHGLQEPEWMKVLKRAALVGDASKEVIDVDSEEVVEYE